MFEITITIVTVSALACDVARRHINDQRAAREFRAEQASRLLQELQDTTKAVKEFLDASQTRQQVQEQALLNFVNQAKQLIQYSEDRRKDAQKAHTRASL